MFFLSCGVSLPVSAVGPKRSGTGSVWRGPSLCDAWTSHQRGHLQSRAHDRVLSRPELIRMSFHRFHRHSAKKSSFGVDNRPDNSHNVPPSLEEHCQDIRATTIADERGGGFSNADLRSSCPSWRRCLDRRNASQTRAATPFVAFGRLVGRSERQDSHWGLTSGVFAKSGSEQHSRIDSRSKTGRQGAQTAAELPQAGKRNQGGGS